MNGNVKTLTLQMEKVLHQIDQNQREIQDLKADLKEVKVERRGQAIKTAATTVVNVHERILSRVIALEHANSELKEQFGKFTLTNINDANRVEDQAERSLR